MSRTRGCVRVFRLLTRTCRAKDVGYIATIQMGTPPRDFKLLMDSGSADLWVGSENCQSEGGGGCVSTHTRHYSRRF